MSENLTALIIVYAGIAIAVFVGALIFFVPTFIAFIRRLKNKWIVFLINLFGSSVFGIGWIISLIWAIIPEPFDSIIEKIFPKKTSDATISETLQNTKEIEKVQDNTPNFCPNCGVKLTEKTPFCANCGFPLQPK